MSGKAIKFTLDGKEVEAREGETIWQVAKREGTSIPHLCWRDEPGYRADGNCRACMVEVEGERVLAASCIRQPAEGMVVNSQNERASTARKMVIELLMADQPDREDAHDQQSSFFKWADSMQVDVSRFPRDDAPKPDVSHPAIAVNLDACIHCNLCVRACREVQVNDVIGMASGGRTQRSSSTSTIRWALSTCVTCGECVQACPTGALYRRRR
jgi:formate dehydrogenase major subunit